MWLTVSFHYTWALLREKRIKAKKNSNWKSSFCLAHSTLCCFWVRWEARKERELTLAMYWKVDFCCWLIISRALAGRRRRHSRHETDKSLLLIVFPPYHPSHYTSCIRCIALFLTLKFVTRMCRRCSTGINSHESRCSLSLVHVWAHSCIMFVFDLSPKQQSNYVLWSSVGRCCRGGGDATGQRSSITILMCIVSIAADERASIKSKKEERRSDDGEKAIN